MYVQSLRVQYVCSPPGIQQVPVLPTLFPGASSYSTEYLLLYRRRVFQGESYQVASLHKIAVTKVSYSLTPFRTHLYAF